MTKYRFSMVIFTVLLSSGFLLAQSDTKFKIEEFDYRVAVRDPGPIMVSSAFVEKSVRDENGESKEASQLSFTIPKHLVKQLERTTLKLTAYDAKGKVFGMRVWHKVPYVDKTNKDASAVPIALDVNPDFAKAARFSLVAGILEINTDAGEIAAASTTCPGCVDLAVQTCGDGRVASVKCGTTKDGSTCEFTCKP